MTSTESRAFDYIVIGAGIAGLVAAFRLSQKGHSVAVLEPGLVGGCIQTVVQSERILELGPHTLALNSELQQLLSDLGLLKHVEHIPIKKLKQYIWNAGQLHRLPRSPYRLLQTKLLSWMQKQRLLRGLFRSTPQSFDGMSVRQAFDSLLGNGLADIFLDPMARGIFGGDIAQLEFESVFPRLAIARKEGKSIFAYAKSLAKTGRKVIRLRDGNAELVTRLEEQLKQKVTFIAAAADKIQVGEDSKVRVSVEQAELRARAVVVACPAEAAGALLSGLDSTFGRDLQVQRSAYVAALHFLAKRSPVTDNTFGALVPKSAGSPLMGVLCSENLSQKRHSDQVITVCMGGVDWHSLQKLSDEELTKLARSEVQKLVGWQLEKLLHLHRWPHAIPQYEYGHKVWREKELAAFQNKYPYIVLAGSFFGGISVPDRIKTAEEAVQKLLATAK